MKSGVSLQSANGVLTESWCQAIQCLLDSSVFIGTLYKMIILSIVSGGIRELWVRWRDSKGFLEAVE